MTLVAAEVCIDEVMASSSVFHKSHLVATIEALENQSPDEILRSLQYETSKSILILKKQ